MYKAGLLVLTSPLAHVRANIDGLLGSACRWVQSLLYISLQPKGFEFGRKTNVDFNYRHTELYRSTVADFYTRSVTQCRQELDLFVLLEPLSKVDRKHFGNLQVLLSDSPALPQDDLATFTSLPVEVISGDSFSQPDAIRNGKDLGVALDPNELSKIDIYQNICMGGTFDRFHTGHKILLAEAAMRCTEQLVIGVTKTAMHEHKILAQLIEPYDVRCANLTNFFNVVRPSLKIHLAPLTDPCGPAITMPELQCIVVSEETRRGGDRVNALRNQKNMSELDVHVVNILPDERSPAHIRVEDKISSVNARKAALGTLLHPPVPKPELPSVPYTVGFTGGIASGKSTSCEYLKSLGATFVDADQLAHTAYAKGTEVFKEVVEAFGDDIIDPRTGEIGRAKLGKIVFSGDDAMKRLTDIVWPAAGRMIRAQLEDFRRAGKTLVIVEAAMLLEADWDQFLHETWVVIAPREIVLQRVMERNKLSQKDAEYRIDMQISNEERVRRANVVIASRWPEQDSQTQLFKAWTNLQKRAYAATH